MKFNGVMIDCVRCMERHDYYFRLIDFMSEWKMNALQLHFTDDSGCAIRLPGLEYLAIKNSFSVAEMKKLIAHAGRRGIDVIPEVEVFGHTRYITENPRHRHLATSTGKHRYKFNAINPLHKDTFIIIERVIRETVKIFPSLYLHLGCDEVNLDDYCKPRGLDKDKVWADYVNAMIALAEKYGRTPIIWADHPAHSVEIARRLRKDAVMMHWQYEKNITDKPIRALKKAGFKKIATAPSAACYIHRFLVPAGAMENIRRMARYSARHKTMGLMNTVWCPQRYLQNAMWYGMAFGAEATRSGGRIPVDAFNAIFSRRVFATPLSSPLRRFLRLSASAAIDWRIAGRLMKRDYAFSAEELHRIRRAHDSGAAALKAAAGCMPVRNRNIFNSMVLAVKAAWMCAEAALLACGEGAMDIERRRNYRRMRRELISEITGEWNRARFEKDAIKPKKADLTGHIVGLVLSLPALR